MCCPELQCVLQWRFEHGDLEPDGGGSHHCRMADALIYQLSAIG